MSRVLTSALALSLALATFGLVGCGGGDPNSGTGGGTGGSSGTGGTSGTGGSSALPDPEVGLVGARESWNGYSYIPPQGDTKQTFTDGVMFTTPKNCTISLRPMVAASGDPGAQALSELLAFVSPDFTALRDEYSGTSPLTHRWRGLTVEGYPWVMVRGFLVNTSGAVAGWAQAMLVTVGSQAALIVGIGDSEACFHDVSGETLDWEYLYHSLTFPGATPPASPRLATQLVGKWMINTGSIFIGETYAANGHYATASAYQTYSQVTSTSVLETTTTFLGDGTFEAHDNRLTTQKTGGDAKTNLFTIIEMENSSAPGGWLPSLRRISKSVVDGKPYEGYLVRDNT